MLLEILAAALHGMRTTRLEFLTAVAAALKDAGLDLSVLPFFAIAATTIATIILFGAGLHRDLRMSEQSTKPLQTRVIAYIAIGLLLLFATICLVLVQASR